MGSPIPNVMGTIIQYSNDCPCPGLKTPPQVFPDDGRWRRQATERCWIVVGCRDYPVLICTSPSVPLSALQFTRLRCNTFKGLKMHCLAVQLPSAFYSRGHPPSCWGGSLQLHFSILILEYVISPPWPKNCRQGRIGSVKYNPSLEMMIKWWFLSYSRRPNLPEGRGPPMVISTERSSPPDWLQERHFHAIDRAHLQKIRI